MKSGATNPPKVSALADDPSDAQSRIFDALPSAERKEDCLSPTSRRTKASNSLPTRPSLDPEAAIAVLIELKSEVEDSGLLYEQGESARASWKSRVLSVLIHALGSDSELTEKVRANHYGLMAFSSGTPESAWVQAHREGVDRAKGYIDAAIFELTLRRDATVRQEAQGTANRESGGRTASEPTPDPRAVFVVHGRNAPAREAMFDFLRSLGLVPIEWVQAVQATGRPSPYVGEILTAAFQRAQAVLVLLTPDDEGRLREHLRSPGDALHDTELTPQARANVLFEAGMAMAWDENRTVLVELGPCRPFSDVAGRHVLRIDDTSQRRQELASRLASAGLTVDMSGTDWHRAGSFDATVS